MPSTKATNDLTTGGILQKLLLVAVPIMGTQLMQMSYNLTDMFWLGRLGPGAVAASGTAGLFMWMSAGVMLIGRMGAEIGVSQSLGRDDPDEAHRYARQAILMALVLGTLFGVLLIALNRPLVGFFAIKEADVASDTRLYLQLVSLAMPFNFLTSAIIGCFNASGNSRSPFYVNAVGLVANMILDPLLIFVFDMGIAGAAVATAGAQILSCVLMVMLFLRGKKSPFPAFRFTPKIDGSRVKQILRWSLPIGLQSTFFTLMSMIISRFVAQFGADAIAVNKVGVQIESLSWLVGGGFGSALTAFMGQNFGAGKWTRIRKGFRMSLHVMCVYGAAISALMFFGAAALFSIFINEPALVAMGVTYIRIITLCQIPQCIEDVAGSTFKGIGKTTPPSVVSMTTNVIRVFLAYALSQTALGLNGIWWALSITAAMRGGWVLAWCLLDAKKRPREDAAEARLPLGGLPHP